MIGLLVLLIFSWVFFPKLWRKGFKAVFSLFKKRNYKVLQLLGKGLLGGVRMLFKGLFWIVHQIIKVIYELLDYLKLKLWI